jgi:hypothetical protein
VVCSSTIDRRLGYIDQSTLHLADVYRTSQSTNSEYPVSSACYRKGKCRKNINSSTGLHHRTLAVLVTTLVLRAYPHTHGASFELALALSPRSMRALSTLYPTRLRSRVTRSAWVPHTPHAASRHTSLRVFSTTFRVLRTSHYHILSVRSPQPHRVLLSSTVVLASQLRACSWSPVAPCYSAELPARCMTVCAPRRSLARLVAR